MPSLEVFKKRTAICPRWYENSGTSCRVGPEQPPKVTSNHMILQLYDFMKMILFLSNICLFYLHLPLCKQQFGSNYRKKGKSFYVVMTNQLNGKGIQSFIFWHNLQYGLLNSAVMVPLLSKTDCYVYLSTYL